MSSRRRREHESSSRREAYKVWASHESESDHRPRQTMTTSQRPNVELASPPVPEKPHRSRRPDALGDPLTSSSYTHHRTGSKEQANPAGPSSSYYSVAQAQAQLLQNTVPLADPTHPEGSSSRPRTKEPSSSKDPHSHSSSKRRAEKRSSPSSDEKILVERSARPSKHPRDTYQPTDTAPLAPTSTQTYWIPPDQLPREPPPRPREKDLERERERERRHAEKARLKEEERARRKAEEKARLREEEKVRERAAEYERQRRREKDAERERRHQEKDRERERSGKHNKDREKPRDLEIRRRDDSRYPDIANGYPQVSAPTGQPRWANTDDRVSTRQLYPDQMPSSSSSVALPATQSSTATPAVTRPQASSTDPSRVVQYHPSAPSERKHRSRRDKTPQYGAQESGLSSSEQESGRERVTRMSDRKRGTGNTTDGQSGPSGSETERSSKSKYHRARDIDPSTQARTLANQKQISFTPPASHPSVHQTNHVSATVGPAPTPYKPQIVSIRAGQGPSDQQMPLVPPKTLAPDTGKPYGSFQDSRVPPGPGPSQMSYLQVPPELYGSARAANHAPAQNGYIHSQPNPQQPSTTTHTPYNPSQPPHHSGQHHSDPIARAPSAAPIPPVKSAPTPAPTHNSPLPPLPAKSQTVPSPRRQIQSLPALPKGDIPVVIPHKVDDQYFAHPSAPPTTGTSFAKLSVYQEPGAPITGELSFPPSSAPAQPASHSQSYHPHASSAPALDAMSRFPVNEDVLNVASSHKASMTGRSVTFPPPAHGGHAAQTHVAPPSPMQLPSHRPYPQPGEDTPRAAPIPIPEPRSMAAMAAQAQVQAQVQAQQATAASTPTVPHQPVDPRSPKHALTTPAPILSSSPFPSTRPHHSPLQSAPAAISQFNTTPTSTPLDVINSIGANHSPSRLGQATVPSTPGPNYASHSPSRSTQVNIARSSPAVAASNLTPKQSPSGRMHMRNGSSDTISAAAAKHSPASAKENNLAQRTSISNMQQPHATSRQDTNALYSRHGQSPPTSNAVYPDSARYRTSTLPQSQAPVTQVPYPTQPASVSIQASQAQYLYPSNQPGSYPTPSIATTRPIVQPTPTPVTSTNNSQPQYDPSGTHRSQPVTAPQTVPSTNQPVSSASAIAAAYRNGTYHSEIASRPLNTTPSSHVPPRSAPSPAPTGAGRHYPSASSATRFAPGLGSVASPQPSRGQMMPALANVRPATTAPTTSHSRSASDPYYGSVQAHRVPVAGHLSTPAPPKHNLEAIRVTSSIIEPEQLRTPSSLAPSMSRHNSFAPSIAPSITPSKEKERKKGFFGLFRSRSSPPKQADVKPPVAPTAKTNAQPRQRASSQSTMQAVATSVKNIVTPHPTNIHVPTPIVAPTPIVPLVSSADQHGGPGSKMFTSFRLISRRHRTVSAASVEAMDGTAPNTVIGGESTRSSTAGRPSPPLRDPVIATFDWRNREEAGQQAKGTLRRHRPGVTFDFEEDAIVAETVPSSRPVRKSSRRYDSK